MVSYLWSIIDQKSVKRNGVRQDVVSNVVTSDRQSIKLLRLSSFDSKTDIFQVSVHANVDSRNSSDDLKKNIKVDQSVIKLT